MPESPAALFALAAALGYALVGTVVLLHHLRQRREAGHLGQPAVQWNGWKGGPHLAVLLLVAAFVGAILMRLEQADMPVGVLGVMVGIGLALHAVAAVVRHRVSATRESLWYAPDAPPLVWDDIDDYVETPTGVAFFASAPLGGSGQREPGLRSARRRIDVAVPRVHREAFALVLSACVDARLEHAVRSAARDVAATRPDRDAV